ncbi:MAG: NAD(P)-dependent oxidoreductase [Fibrobacteres bacterium]|nr:NAD(P)-dependent oxidoreductase [Fibrobacterota bacterium]
MGNKRILLTGSSGFIGRHLLDILTKDDNLIFTIKSPKNINYLQNDSKNIISCDLLDVASCRKLIDETKPTHLLHLAWEARPGIFWNSNDNIRWAESSIELFKYFYKSGGLRGISAGTCAQYSWENINQPLKEYISEDKPGTIYGNSKLEFEREIIRFSNLNNYSYASGRLFMIYGPGENSQRLIPTIISSLLVDKNININTDGALIRDYIFVSDAALAYKQLLFSDYNGIINIASGKGLSLFDIASKVKQILKSSCEVKFKESTTIANNPPSVIADINKLAKTIQFVPQIDIDAGLIKTISWMKKKHSA